MGGTLVFVGNLPWSTTNEQLLELFGQFTPFDVNVKTTMNGRSRGFGIVRFDTPERAEMAINSMQGFVFEGSPQFTGFVPSYDLLDTQVNYRFEAQGLTLKAGASNLLKNEHIETYGGPTVGRLAYMSLSLDVN